MYILFSLLSIIPNIGIQVINKLNTNKHNQYVVCFIKGFYYIALAFVFVCIMGHFGNIGLAFHDIKTSIFLIANALTMGICWIFYFAGFSRSPMGLFTITNICSSVLTTSLLSFILSMDIVTNGKNPINMSLYIIALCLLIGIEIAVMCSKESKENGSRIWIIFTLINGLLGAIDNLVLMNMQLAPAGIFEDTILFYQAIGVTMISLIFSLFIKKVSEIKQFTCKEHIFLSISSLFELLYYFLYDKAINVPGANHAIVTVIACSGLFLLVELAEIIIFKKRPKPYHMILLGVFVVAMILECLAGII